MYRIVKKTLKYMPAVAFGLVLLFSCGASGKPQLSTRKEDSTAIRHTLAEMYKWHGTTGSSIHDFYVVVKDSFQVGIDTLEFHNALRMLKRVDYFSGGFIKNYEDMGNRVDQKLKREKWYNEINFPFQEADPWTFFQDDAGNYWENMVITDMKIEGDSASLSWHLEQPYSTEKYRVKFIRVNKQWKVDYLQGFDIKLD